MIKVLIADDEPKIRRGIAGSVDWSSLDMEVCAFAENGAVALEKIREEKPDICLVDLNMPIVGGFAFIEQMKAIDPDTICIVISGYDEFNYAQRAVSTGVFEYILKPVNEKNLQTVLERAKRQILLTKDRNTLLSRAKKLLNQNLPVLREKFLGDLLSGKYANPELEEQAEFLNFPSRREMGLVLVRLSNEPFLLKSESERQMVQFSTRSLMEELCGACGCVQLYSEDFSRHMALVWIESEKHWNSLSNDLHAAISACVSTTVQVRATRGVSFQSLLSDYNIWLDEDNQTISPMIRQVQDYIDSEYSNSELTMQLIADRFKLNASYLSRTFKQETGFTLTDYLSKKRVHEAIVLLERTNLKICEISQQVGYSSQHYFCVAFKKALGIAPSEYKKPDNK